MGDSAKGTPKKIPVHMLKENPWNPNRMTTEMFELEKKSIRDNGYIAPIIVRTIEAGKSYEIIDGAHRFRALVDLGEDPIRVIDLGVIPDHQAKALTLKLNDIRGDADQELRDKLVQDLLGSYSVTELSETLPYDPDYFAQFVDEADSARDKALEDEDLPATEVGVKKGKKAAYDGLTLVHLLVPNEDVKELNALARKVMKVREMDVERFEVSFGQLVKALLEEALEA